jgi:glycosyltransferase involved in cell wall biosynthesis
MDIFVEVKVTLNFTHMSSHLGYLCSSESWGGLEMNHLRNALWMQARGHHVLVFAVSGSRFAREAQKQNLPVQEIRKHKKYYDFSAGKTFVQLLQKHGITHLLIRATRDMSISAYAKWQLKSRLHTSYFMEMQLGVTKKHPLHAFRHNAIDLWSCPLPWLEKQVRQMTRFKNELVRIPSGMDLSKFSPVPEKEQARKILNLPKNTLVFGLMGRFDPQKGQVLLLEAMKSARNKLFHIVLLGEPTFNEGQAYAARMHAIIDQHELNERVHIRPFMNDPLPFYAATDWLVMATQAESIGMVTMESLACGTPVLGSDAGGTPEVLEHGRGGLLFETMNAEALAKRIDYICEQNITFDSEDLRAMTQQYDHNRVCQSVEQHLGLS